MVKPEFIGIGAIALLFILTYPFVFAGTSGSIGGGTGRTYTSGTPSTIQVNNDNNTISQNFDGNFTTRINALDLNNSLSYAKTDTNCSTSPDCNNLYFKLNPTGAQTVSGGFSSTFTGTIQAPLNQPIAIGRNTAAGINDINFYGAFIQTNPDAGRGAIILPANRCAFEVTNTEICQDFNNTSRAVGLREGIQNPLYYAKIGATTSTYGLQDILPRTNMPTTWGTIEPVDRNDLLQFDYTDYRFVQPMIYNPNWGTGTNGWGHVDKIVYYGTPKDGINDQNSIGDTNQTGNIIQDGNYSFDSGTDSNGMTIAKFGKDLNIFNYDLNGSITFYKTIDQNLVVGLRLHQTGTRVQFPFLTGTLGCGLDATFSGELFCTPSLTSMKVNIEDFNNSIDPNIIYLLKPKLFNGIENPNGKKVAGLLAEDVMQVAPFFGLHDETGALRGVDYKGLNILAISALQDQRRKILALEKRVDDLTNELMLFRQAFCLQFPMNQMCVVAPGV